MAKTFFVGSALVRQWLLLSLLPRPPQKIDAATLESRLRERGHAIHRRTIQRDLVELASVFPIVADERSKPYGWRWAEPRDLRLPLPADGNASRVRVMLRAAPRVAIEVADLLSLERPAASATSLVGDVADTIHTRRVLLAYGLDVEIIEPSLLRDEIRATALRIARRHE